jgi:peptidoglycan hydrolase CwlO-like protein
MRKVKKLLVVVLIGFIVYQPFMLARADDLEDISKKLDELKRIFDDIKRATDTNEATLNNLNKQLEGIKSRVVNLEKEIVVKEKEVEKGEKVFAYQKKLLDERARSHYKNIHKASSTLLDILITEDLSVSLKNYFYQKSLADEDKKTIIKIVMYIKDMEEKKANLVEEKQRLDVLKVDIDKQSQFLAGEVSKAKKYQGELQQQIAELSARQQAILAQKTGTFQTSVGEVPLADDYNASAAYNPGFSPAFAAFSFGAPHFNGLSQYGAYGRAKENQDAETILRAYYGDVEIKKDYGNDNICVGDSAGSCENIPLETYAKRIYEMPGSWGDTGGMEALKAQAVAARSYALSSMARNGYICPTEACQVYKPENKGGKWEEAVNATPGWVMMKNGKPLMAKYASTAGGYIDPYTDSYAGHTTTGFWDTKNGRDGWTSQAYEKIAASPWFYKAWYKTRSGDACGRSHPWLTQEEMADILNGWLVLSHGSDDRVSPLGGCWSGNPYSMAELRDKANGLGGAITSINSVSIEYSNSGFTANVRFSTNKDNVTITGSEFKKIFNLRAPGNISLKSGLYNIEKR